MKVVQYNDNHYNDLLKFTLKAEMDDMKNQKNIDNYPLDESLFLVYIDDEIAGVSHTVNFFDYYEDTYLVFKRTGTLKKYRGKYFPKNKTIIQGSGLLTHALPYQIDYAFSQGAKRICFLTNVSIIDSKNPGSVKLDKYLKRIVNNDPRFSYLGEVNYKNCLQTIWQIHVRDFLDLNSGI